MNIPLTPIRFLRYARQQFSNKTAVVCRDQRFTYAQFADRAGRLAGALLSLGAAPGDRVAFLSANCHHLLEAYFGVLEAGCVLLPLNVRVAPHELAYILNDAGARFLFLGGQFLRTVESFCQDVLSVEAFIALDGNEDTNWLARSNYEDLLAAATPVRRPLDEVDEDSMAELFYTNGTASRPKGVMLTHRNVYLHALSVIAGLQTSPATAGHPAGDSVQLHTIPLFHANGWGAVHSVSLVGGTHVMLQRFNPAEVFRLIQRERVTFMGLVPTMATALVNSPVREKYDLSSLRGVMLGGAATSPSLVHEVEEKLGCACMCGYGLTECSPVLAMSPMKGGLRWEGEQRYAGQAKTGFAVPGAEIRVVDENGNDVPHDGRAVGEVVARGDGIMQGYWRQPEATRAAFAGGWFHTGDVATLDENHYLLIAGRNKDIIISGGENISAQEVEKALAEHPGVFEVAVIATPDPRWGEVPKACIALKPGAQVTAAELLAFARAKLSRYKLPHFIEFYPSLPKDDSGKILKEHLRNPHWMKAAA